MTGGSGFLLLGVCAAGAACLLGILYLLHGAFLAGGGILGGTGVFLVGWRWVGRRFQKDI